MYLLWVSNMDDSLAEVLSFQHIHKRSSGYINTLVDMFLALDAAFDQPLQRKSA